MRGIQLGNGRHELKRNAGVSDVNGVICIRHNGGIVKRGITRVIRVVLVHGVLEEISKFM
jgi:hypothetical protein